MNISGGGTTALSWVTFAGKHCNNVRCMLSTGLHNIYTWFDNKTKEHVMKMILSIMVM